MYFSHGLVLCAGFLGLVNVSTGCTIPMPSSAISKSSTTQGAATTSSTPAMIVPTTTLKAISTSVSKAGTPFEHLGDVLSRAKLQYPKSNLAALPKELAAGFSDFEFQMADNGLVQFQVAGTSHRSELREMKEYGDEVFWGVEETHISRATMLIPEQNKGIEEVTIMQIHGDVAPILRISWMDSKSFGGVLHEDFIAATIRVGLGDSSDNFVKAVLAPRSDSLVDFQITVKASKLSIHVNGKVVVDKQDISFWNGNPTAYFKAGAYNNHPNIEAATAVIYLQSLQW